MLSTHERRRLMCQMEDQSLVEKAIVARCAAALGVVVLIAVLGAAGHDNRGAQSPAEARVPAQPIAGGGAERHRREIFEQRRQRFADGNAGAAQAETASAVVSAAPE